MPTPNHTFPGCRLLIVEDVLPLAIQYRVMAKPLGVEIVTTASVREALSQVNNGPWHAALVDINLPDGSGFEVMQALTSRWPHCSVIVVSGEDSIDNAVRAAHAGAMDFIEKPVDADRLQISLRNGLQAASLAERVEKLEQLEPAKRGQFHAFVGSSPVMRAVYQMVETVSQSKAPVFIRGETGTGKELAADAIHSCSPRKNKPFVALNCATIPKDLMESELFGHIKGAFTGATADRTGAFMEADQGSLFLDEIAEMDIGVQAKLLRALQTGEVKRLGETRSKTVDVRIICATHRDLYAQVQAGRFREDLFYRLYVIALDLPPLRERGDDILEIAQAMLTRYSSEDKKRFKRFSADSCTALVARSWPGNVRELMNVVRAAVALHDGETVEVGMLPLQQSTAAPKSGGSPAPLTAGLAGEPASSPVSTPPQASPENIKPLAQVEQEAIEAAMRACGGNITRAAKALQVNPSTIHRKMSVWT
jgi:two-component system repressor protein LuxO